MACSFSHEVAEQRKMVRVDLRVLGDSCVGDAAVMRDDVVRLGHADLRVADAARFDALHEGGHASDVGSPRERDEVVHHANVLFVSARDAGGRIGSLADRIGSLPGWLDPAFDFADVLQVLVDRRAVLRREPAVQAACGCESPNRECWPCS